MRKRIVIAVAPAVFRKEDCTMPQSPDRRVSEKKEGNIHANKKTKNY
jgi:hypothetical protein